MKTKTKMKATPTISRGCDVAPYAIWMDEGQVHGRDHEHWHQAEREIAAETSAHAPPAAAEPQEKSQAAAGGSKTTGMAQPSPKSATAGSSKTTESPLRTGP